MDMDISPESEVMDLMLTQMMDMGFSVEDSRRALLATGSNSIEIAASYLLEDPTFTNNSTPPPVENSTPKSPTRDKDNSETKQKDKGSRADKKEKSETTRSDRDKTKDKSKERREKDKGDKKEKTKEKDKERKDKDKTGKRSGSHHSKSEKTTTKPIDLNETKEKRKLETKGTESGSKSKSSQKFLEPYEPALSDSWSYELEQEKAEYAQVEQIHLFSLKSVKILDERQALKKAVEEVEGIASMLSVSFTEAAATLRYFKWNKDVLNEKYFDSPETVKKALGLSAQGGSSKHKPQKGGASISCGVCFDDIPASSADVLPCNHYFCKTCWTDYLSLKIKDGESVGLTCMGHKCPTIVPETVVKKYVDKNSYEKYLHFIAKAFLDTNPNVRWCPSEKCGNCIWSEFRNEKVAQCTCGLKFCFMCNAEAHIPATCEQMKVWKIKAKDDSETKNWLTANTKDCPKCHTAIEKNGGCQHMTCRKCSHEFCWICFGNWVGHSACNRYEEDQKLNQAKSSLEKYLHYYNRYEFHENSKKAEVALREKAYEAMICLRNHAMENASESHVPLLDFQYLDRATEQIIECRRTLKYTYVFAFYLDSGAEKTLFEYLQEQLETQTEALAALLEAPAGTHPSKDIINCANAAGKRLKHLLEGVEDGLIPKGK